MECPKCHTENPESRKFCRECGHKLSLVCPECGTENTPGDKFCGECGNLLSKKMAVQETSSYIESERKNVTVLFSDMSGYTSLTERLDPEDVKDLMSRIFGEIAQVITKYEGFIERFIGDAVMAIFGVPKTHEDDPIRAIKAAREIHALVESISPKIEEKVGQRVTMHSGINTGLVVTGEVNLEEGTHGITGDAINLASRLEGIAGPGEILTGHETYKQAEGYFIFERLEPVKVKGKEKPIVAYRMIAPSTRRTRFEVSAQRGLTPLTGRKRELEQLIESFDRVKSGRGQAISIVSEAGIGKSRLLYEFRKVVAKEKVTFLEGKCLSYGKGIAYHPLIDILKSNFDIMESDGDQEIKEKIRENLNALSADEVSTLPYFLELLSVEDNSINKIPMSPESKKNRIIDSLKRITLKGSEVQPLVIAIEDLHWMDKSSEQVFKELLDYIPEARVFFLFTFRPEFIPPWSLKSYHAQITLNRLSENQAFEMVGHLLDSKNVDIGLKKLLFKKTERIPLFLEEFVKSFIDLKLIEKKDKYYLVKNVNGVDIPSTIQDVIMARVDSLPEGAKEVAQAGSVIGREFSYELISQVINISEKALISHLSALRDSELVNERGIFPQSSHIFKHALTRDVVYNSILNKRKKELHKRIGLTIEINHKNKLSEVVEILAEHFEKCEDYKRAVAYFKISGTKATNSGAVTESVNYAKKTVDCLERLPKSEELLEKIVDIRTILGIRLLDLNYFRQSKEIISPIIETADKMGHTRRIAQINTILGAYYFCVSEDFTQSFEHHFRSLGIARNLEDNNLMALAHYWLGWPLAFSCDFEGAHDHFSKALNIHVQARNPIFTPLLSALTGHIVYHYWGRQTDAYEYSNKAVFLADESGDIYTRLLAYSCHGVSCLGKGEMDNALKYLSTGLGVAKQIDQFYWQPGNHQFLGDTYYELGDYQKSIYHYKAAIRNLERSGNLPSWKNMTKLSLIRAELAAGEEQEFDLKSLDQYLNANKICVYDGLVKRYIGEIMTYQGELKDAEYWFEQAAENHQEKNMRYHLAGDHVVRATAYMRHGDPNTAQEYLTKAIDIFRECGADGWVEKYKRELKKL